MTTSTAIDVEGVSVAYGSNVVLRDISLAVAPGEFFGPFQEAAAELETVEIDAAEPEHCRPEHVPQRPRLLLDHAVIGQGPHDSMHGGVRQVEPGGQVAETEATGGLQGEQDTDGSINTLDHAANFLEEIS